MSLYLQKYSLFTKNAQYYVLWQLLFPPLYGKVISYENLWKLLVGGALLILGFRFCFSQDMHICCTEYGQPWAFWEVINSAQRDREKEEMWRGPGNSTFKRQTQPSVFPDFPPSNDHGADPAWHRAMNLSNGFPNRRCLGKGGQGSVHVAFL